MNKAIQSILGDLYKLNPKLKKSEKDLVPMLQRLVEAKPRIELDSGFVKNLRHQLTERANELMENEKSIRPNWFARILAPLMGGTMAFAALMIGLMVWNGQWDFARKPETVPQPTPMSLRMELPPVSPGPSPSPEASTFAEPTPIEPTEPIVVEPVPIPTPAPTPKAEPSQKAIQKTTPAPSLLDQKAQEPDEIPPSEPMMLKSLPSEGSIEIAAPAPATIMPPESGGTTDEAVTASAPEAKTSIYQSMLDRAKSGERKITSGSKQIGTRSPQELMTLNFDNLPDGFREVTGVLPAGYKIFMDTASGAPEYYIYIEGAYQWYGPF